MRARAPLRDDLAMRREIAIGVVRFTGAKADRACATRIETHRKVGTRALVPHIIQNSK